MRVFTGVARHGLGDEGKAVGCVPPTALLFEQHAALNSRGALLEIATGHLPRDATASHNETNDTMNVLHLEQTHGAKALPRQDLPDEIYR